MRFFFLLLACLNGAIMGWSQFSPTPSTWPVPPNFEGSLLSGRLNSADHATLDLNGNGLPDLIDGIDNMFGTVYVDSILGRHWKVYFNNGNGFVTPASDWNVPPNFEGSLLSGRVRSNDHAVLDLTGDGQPDLIDGIDNATGVVYINGSLGRHWKVYINEGSGFENTPIDWDVPENFEGLLPSGRVSSQNHALMDLDGDGRLDLIDGINNASGVVYDGGSVNRHWKVYLNNKNGFSNTPVIWNVPGDFEGSLPSGRTSSDNHSTFDMNGDQRPDLIDGIDNFYGTVYTNSSLGRHWKVYLNNGVGFDNVPVDWDVPDNFEGSLLSGRTSGSDHQTLDVNGDSLPDLIDGIDNFYGTVYTNSSLGRHWKVYLNTGNGFKPAPVDWDVPDNFEGSLLSGRTEGANHGTLDLDGDGFADLVDGINNWNGVVWENGNGRYWKVYRQSPVGVPAPLDRGALEVYPQPAGEFIVVGLPQSLRKGLLELVDGSGKLVRRMAVAGQLSVRVDVSDLPTGLYLLRLRATDRAGRPWTSSQKLLVH